MRISPPFVYTIILSEIYTYIQKIENFSPISISMRYNEEQRDKELAYFIKELKRQRQFLLQDIEERMNFYIRQAEYIEELIRRDRES
tara:strand:- start:17 stop:277 length:261 start_codon:yes stop_codon:yes gene_type:complete